MRDGDLSGCARYLDGVSGPAEVAPLWRQLAEQALANNYIQVRIGMTVSNGTKTIVIYRGAYFGTLID